MVTNTFTYFLFRREVSHIEYVVLVNGENVEFIWESPSQNDINKQLGEKAKVINQTSHPLHATYVKGYVSRDQREKLPEVLEQSWQQANAGELFMMELQ